MKRFKVALIEDNPDHVFLITRTIEGCEDLGELRVFSTAEEALRKLSGGDDNSFVPDFLLVDLKLPGMSGQEFLHRLHSSGELAKMPAFVLTSSDRLKDRLECEELGALGYFLKPLLDDDLDTIIKRLVSADPLRQR
ncbi:MAG: response regulator [bacterium]|nr:response regulator [bacterium]MDT8396958.1 response regulator [bacterium]